MRVYLGFIWAYSIGVYLALILAWRSQGCGEGGTRNVETTPRWQRSRRVTWKATVWAAGPTCCPKLPVTGDRPPFLRRWSVGSRPSLSSPPGARNPKAQSPSVSHFVLCVAVAPCLRRALPPPKNPKKPRADPSVSAGAKLLKGMRAQGDRGGQVR